MVETDTNKNQVSHTEVFDN